MSVGFQNYEEDDLDAVTLPAVTNGTAELVVAEKEGADIDTAFIYGGGNFSENTNWLVGYSEADVDGDDANDDPVQLTWGVYHNLGGGLKLYYEATDLDIEANDQDGARHLLGMRVDF